MIKSNSIKEIANALAVFQGAVEAVKKDSDNPFFHSKYASLDSILKAIDQPLATAELSFAQFPDGANGLTTILMHAPSGEWIEATYTIPLAKNDPQGAGSALTYMRRYALGAILGLATETDDDANTASTPKSIKPPVKASTPITERVDEPFPSHGVAQASGAPLNEPSTGLSDINWD